MRYLVVMECILLKDCGKIERTVFRDPSVATLAYQTVLAHNSSSKTLTLIDVLGQTVSNTVTLCGKLDGGAVDAVSQYVDLAEKKDVGYAAGDKK